MPLIIKRNKKAQEFSKDKVLNSVRRSFESCNASISDSDLDNIYNDLVIKDGMRTEDIQKQVEDILMRRGYWDEARFFIIWRHIHYYDNYLGTKVKFMREYLSSINPATGSKFDANANVTEKNLATLSNELFKGDIIKLNRYRLHAKIQEMYGKDLADEYLRQLETHEIYKHDESSILPYCVAISMYPFLLGGFAGLGGVSDSPKSLSSFCGSFINLVFAISAQFAGAVATPEFLLYFDKFARDDFGQDYSEHASEFYTIGPKLRKLMNESGIWFKDAKDLKSYDFHNEELNQIKNEVLYNSSRNLSESELSKYLAAKKKGVDLTTKIGDGSRTIGGILNQYFQQVVYSINQPAAARGYQSVFWNIGYFDKYYFDGIFGEFKFPDGTKPVWESLSWLQKKFIKWFNNERTKKILTFPVESFSLLVNEKKEFKDKASADFVAEMYSKGHSFFTYISDNPDALSSCCRLRNDVVDNQFSFSLGMGGVATGSKSVMTINLNRLIQNAVKNKVNYTDYLRDQIKKVHKYQTAFNEMLKEFYDQGALSVYSQGFIALKKQYLTLGINGMVEAAEYLGIPTRPCPEYEEFVQSILSVFYEENKKARTKELMFNTEFVPAENLGVKFYNWDKESGYVVPNSRNCYNSYYYPSESTELTILDKFKLHGGNYVKYLDGGSALHMNLEEHLSKEQYKKLLRVAADNGTNYFTFNIPNTICNKCGHIDKRYLRECPDCGSNDVDYATRIIGYLKRISNFSKSRQDEARIRHYSKIEENA